MDLGLIATGIIGFLGVVCLAIASVNKEGSYRITCCLAAMAMFFLSWLNQTIEDAEKQEKPPTEVTQSINK